MNKLVEISETEWWLECSCPMWDSNKIKHLTSLEHLRFNCGNYIADIIDEKWEYVGECEWC